MPPQELLEFDVDRWAPGDIARDDPWRPTRAHERWRQARAAWVDAGGVWPDDGGPEEEILVGGNAIPDEPWSGFDAPNEHGCYGAHCDGKRHGPPPLGVR